MNYYEHHIGDYLKDTISLSLVEDGAYRRLIDAYYSQEAPLPADIRECCKLARATTKLERDAVAKVLGKYFTLTEAGYRKGRVEEEIEKAHKKIEASRANGRTGGRPKKNPEETRQDIQQKPTGFPLGSETGTQPKALQIPDTKHQIPDSSLRSLSEARDPGAWEAHRQWALDELRSIYPSNLYTDADWESAARTVAGKLNSGETTREALHTLVLQFAAKKDAEGCRNTQFVENPVRHFDGRGKWKGPFFLPATKAQQKQDSNIDAATRWLAGSNA